MTFTDDQISAFLAMYLWPFFRIGAMLMAFPVLNSTMLPFMIRLMLSIGITMAIAPLLPPMPPITVIDMSLLLNTINQIIIGVAMGFIMQLVFQVFTMAGQLIAMQSGFGFAAMVEPGSSATVPIISQIYILFINLIFLSLNGHLVAIEVLVDSFQKMPVASDSFSAQSIQIILDFSAWMFKSSLLVALPAVIALLVANIALGVMTRAAPQMNIFSIGFPITLSLGLLIIYMSFSMANSHFNQMLTIGFNTMKELYSG